MSFVATSRNDDHGGDLRGRMQWFVNGLDVQCRRHNLPGELVLVEWNPPLDRPPLAEALRWPADDGPLGVRIVTVPTELHDALDHAHDLPMFQMIAKNVGIRRARGDFVVATNIDILFSDGAMVAMAHRLRSDNLYRADRHDVIPHPPLGAPFDDVLSSCKRCTIRINRREGTYLVPEQRFLPIYQNFREILMAWFRRQVARLVRFFVKRPALGVLHLLAWLRRQVVRLVRFFVLRPLQGLWRLPSRLHRQVARLPGLRRQMMQPPGLRHRLARLPGLIFQGVRRLPSLLRRRRQRTQRPARGHRTLRQKLSKSVRHLRFAVLGVVASPVWAWRELRDAWNAIHELPQPHTNGCGDFTLLSRGDWFKLRGYPEWPIFSWHLDSVLLHQALACGIRVVEFPRESPVFHLEHGKGSGFTPEGEVLLFGRLRDVGVPFLSSVDFGRVARELLDQTGSTPTFNDIYWGMVTIDLPELELTRPSWGDLDGASSASRSPGTREGGSVL